MWFLVVAIPRRFPGILRNYGKSSLRQKSSGIRAPRFAKRLWTYDEDQKLKDLCRQGFSLQQIGAELNRSRSSLYPRIAKLKHEVVTPTKEKKGVNQWSDEEDALLLEKFDSGMNRKEIATFFPGRTYKAVECHLRRVLFAVYGREKLARHVTPKFTDEFIQRFIDLRLKGAKSVPEIAVELNHSQNCLEEIWSRRCLPLLSTEERDSIQRQTYWTPQEMKHLLELQDRGMTLADVVRQFPSKTYKSVIAKIAREHLQFPRRNYRTQFNPAFKLVKPSAASGKDESDPEEQA
jgi:hypothetical protein